MAQVFTVCSPFAESVEPITVVVTANKLQVIDPRLNTELTSLDFGSRRLHVTALSTGELVIALDDRPPIAVHASAKCLFGLSAIWTAMKVRDADMQTGAEYTRDVVLLRKDLIESNAELKLFLESNENVSFIFESCNSKTYRCSANLLTDACGVPKIPTVMDFLQRSKDVDASEKHLERVRYESIKRLFVDYVDEMNEEALRSVLWRQNASEKYLELARVGLFASSGKLRHASDGLCFPCDNLDFKHLLNEPEIELARFGCKPLVQNVPLSDSLAYSAFHAVVSPGGTETGNDDPIAVVASSVNAPVVATARNSGLVTVHTRLEGTSLATVSLSQVFTFPVCNGNAIVALAVSPASDHHLTQLEIELNSASSSCTGNRKVFPGASVLITQGRFESFVGDLLSVANDGKSGEVQIEVSGVKTVETIDINTLQFVKADDGDLVFLLPLDNDRKKLGKIGRVVGPFLNAESSTFLVRVGLAAAEPLGPGKVVSSSHMFVPPVNSWSVSTHAAKCTKAALPIPYPSSHVVVLSSASARRAGLEFETETSEGLSNRCSFAIITEEGLTLFRRQWSISTCMWETKPVRFWSSASLTRVEFVSYDTLLVADKTGRVYVLDEKRPSSSVFDSPVLESCKFDESSSVRFTIGAGYIAVYTATAFHLFRVAESTEGGYTTLVEIEISNNTLPKTNLSAVYIELSGTQLRLCFENGTFSTLSIPVFPIPRTVTPSLRDQIERAAQLMTWTPIRFLGCNDATTCWRISASYLSRTEVVISSLQLDTFGIWSFSPVVDTQLDHRSGRPVFGRFDVVLFDQSVSVLLDVVDEATGEAIPCTRTRAESTERSVTMEYEIKLGCERVRLVIAPSIEASVRGIAVLGEIRFWGRADERDDDAAFRLSAHSQDFISKVLSATSECDRNAFDLRKAALSMIVTMFSLVTFDKELILGPLRGFPCMRAFIKANFVFGDGNADTLIVQVLSLLISADETLKMKQTVAETCIDLITSDEVLTCSSKQSLDGLFNLLQNTWPALSESSISAEERLLDRLIGLGQELRAKEDGRIGLLRNAFGFIQNPMVDQLLDAVEIEEHDAFELNPPTNGQSVTMAAQTAAAFASATHTAASLTAAAAGTSSAAATSAILALAASLGGSGANTAKPSSKGDVAGVAAATKPEILPTTIPYASSNRLDVRVHSATSYSTTTFKRDETGHWIEVTFSDILARSRESTVVWDLSHVRSLTGAQVIVSLTDPSDVPSGSFCSFVTTGETFLSSPPFVGERMSYPARDDRGVPFDIELCACSGAFSFDKREGAIGVKSMFPTIAPRGVSITSGKWYYEVTLLKTSDGVAQIGFCDSLFSGDDKLATGAGDDEHSWAFDGNRVKKWSGQASSWGKKWKDGDVLGCAIDLEEKKVWFSLNGSWKKPMGVAFSDIVIAGGVFPAVTAERSFKCKMNFGQLPLKFSPPPKDGFRPVLDWILTNRDATGVDVQSRVWFRKSFSDSPLLAWTHKPEGAALARYLRISIAAKDWAPNGSLDGDGTDSTGPVQRTMPSTPTPTSASSNPSLSLKTRLTVVRPRIQGRISVKLFGSSRPYWEVRASSLLSGCEHAVNTLLQQREVLIAEMAKDRQVTAKCREDLAFALDIFQTRLGVLAASGPRQEFALSASGNVKKPIWSPIDAQNILRKRQDGSLTDNPNPLTFEALKVLEAAERCWGGRKQMALTQARLQAVERELVRFGCEQVFTKQNDLDYPAVHEVRLQLAKFLTTLLMEKCTGGHALVVPIDKVTDLFTNLCMEAATFDSQNVAKVVLVLLARCSKIDRADFFVTQSLRFSKELTIPTMCSVAADVTLLRALDAESVWSIAERLLASGGRGSLHLVQRALVEARRRKMAMPGGVFENDRASELAIWLLELFPTISAVQTSENNIPLEEMYVLHLALGCLLELKSISTAPEVFLERLLDTERFHSLFKSCSCFSANVAGFVMAAMFQLLNSSDVGNNGAGISRVGQKTRKLATLAVKTNPELTLGLFLQSVHGRTEFSWSEDEHQTIEQLLLELSSLFTASNNDANTSFRQSDARAMALALRLLTFGNNGNERPGQARILRDCLNHGLQLVDPTVQHIVREDLVAFTHSTVKKGGAQIIRIVLEALIECFRAYHVRRRPLDEHLFERLLQAIRGAGSASNETDALLVRLIDEVGLSLFKDKGGEVPVLVALVHTTVSSCVTVIQDKRALSGVAVESCMRMVRWIGQADPPLTREQLTQRRKLCGCLAKLFLIAASVPCFQFLRAILIVIEEEFASVDPISPSVTGLTQDVILQLARRMIGQSSETAGECASAIVKLLHASPPTFLIQNQTDMHDVVLRIMSEESIATDAERDTAFGLVMVQQPEQLPVRDKWTMVRPGAPTLFQAIANAPLNKVSFVFANDVASGVGRIHFELGAPARPLTVKAECGLSPETCVPLGEFAFLGASPAFVLSSTAKPPTTSSAVADDKPLDLAGALSSPSPPPSLFSTIPPTKFAYSLQTTSYIPCNVIRVIVEFSPSPSNQFGRRALEEDNDDVWFRKGDKVRLLRNNSYSGTKIRERNEGCQQQQEMPPTGSVIDFDGEIVSIKWDSGRVDAVNRRDVCLQQQSTPATFKQSSSGTTSKNASDQQETGASGTQQTIIAIHRVQIMSHELSPIYAFEGCNAAFLEMLVACCDQFPNEVTRKLLTEDSARIGDILQRMIAVNAEIPRKLAISISSISPSLGNELVEKLLKSVTWDSNYVALVTELCCRGAKTAEVASERAKALLTGCRVRLRQTEQQNSADLQLLRAWMVVVEELALRRGIDIGVEGDDVGLISDLMLRKYLEGSLLELCCSQLLHALARASESARKRTTEIVQTSGSNLRTLRLLGALCSEAEEAALERLYRMREDCWKTWNDVSEPFIATLVHLADISHRVRGWLRETGWLQSVLNEFLHVSEISEQAVDRIDGKEATAAENASLALLTTAMNRDKENQLLVARAIADGLAGVTATVSEGKTTRFLVRLLDEASRFVEHVPVFVWNLDWELERLAKGLPDHSAAFNPFGVSIPVELSRMTPSSSLASLFATGNISPAGSSGVLGEGLTAGVSSSLSSAMTSLSYSGSSISSVSSASSSSANRMMPFRLNPNACGKTIEIAPSGLSASQIAAEKWGVVRGDRELPTSGVSSWEVKLDHSPKGHIFVGVATSRSNVDGYLGCDRYGWGFIGNRGIWHNKHKENTYGKDFRTGDVVKVVVDATEGTLSFVLNGEDLGVAFTGLIGLKLFPAFSLYQKGDRFTLLSSSFAKAETDDVAGLLGTGGGSLASLLAQEKLFIKSRLVSALVSPVLEPSFLQGNDEEDRSLLDKMRFGDLGARARFMRGSQVFTVKSSAALDQILAAIGKGALLNALKIKFGREELSRLDQSPSASWEIEVRGTDPSAEVKSGETIQQLLATTRKDFLELDLSLSI